MNSGYMTTTGTASVNSGQQPQVASPTLMAQSQIESALSRLESCVSRIENAFSPVLRSEPPTVSEAASQSKRPQVPSDLVQKLDGYERELLRACGRLDSVLSRCEL